MPVGLHRAQLHSQTALLSLILLRTKEEIINSYQRLE
jgi:hypothetical protein